MYDIAGAAEFGLVFVLVGAENIYGNGSCQRRNSRTRRRKCRRNKSQNKQDAHSRRQELIARSICAGGEVREKFVCLQRVAIDIRQMSVHKQSQLRRVLVQQHAQRKEKQVDRQKTESVTYNVFLRVLQILATQIFLHHILVESCHCYRGKHSRKKLFEEELLVVDVVKIPNPRHRRIHHRRHHSAKIQSQLFAYVPDAQHHSHYQRQCLQHISPHQRLDAATVSVEPDHEHRDSHIEPERYAQAVEDD